MYAGGGEGVSVLKVTPPDPPTISTAVVAGLPSFVWRGFPLVVSEGIPRVVSEVGFPPAAD